MAPRPRGECIACGLRRTLTVDMCDPCTDNENEMQERHQFDVAFEGESARQFEEWRAGWKASYEQSIDDQLREAFMAGWSRAPIAASDTLKECDS